MNLNDPLSRVPSRNQSATVSVAASAPSSTGHGLMVGPDGAVPDGLGLDRAALTAQGFDGQVGSTVAVPSADGTVVVAVGVGANPDTAAWRDAAAAFARATAGQANLAIEVAGADTGTGDDDAIAEALVEGALLARYRYDALRSTAPTATAVSELTLVSPDTGRHSALAAGAERGRVLAAATAMSRDLANTPHSHLSASDLAELATAIGPGHGLTVEVFDKAALLEMGVGGLLAINAGSSQPPRMIKLTYTPSGAATGRLALVGKGVMYDSGGLGIKPNDRMHAQMKNDMSGAAAVLSAMCVLGDLGCTNQVTGYLMCTDNMPSGTAIALGDVITIRGGKTVEVMDTDAEGRVVMSDALVLAAEDGHDAVVDIATLTGAAMRALGPDMSALIGNHQPLADLVSRAGHASGELVWQLPLHRPYRKDLDSLVADMANVSYGDAGAITAALFLAEFVGDTPWAHVDMCGPAQVSGDAAWRIPGCSGYGARLLAHVATTFQASTVS